MSFRVHLPDGNERVVHVGESSEGLHLVEGNPLELRGAHDDLLDVLAGAATAAAAGFIRPERAVPARTALQVGDKVVAVEVHGTGTSPKMVLVEVPSPEILTNPIPGMMAQMAMGWPRGIIAEREAPLRVIDGWHPGLAVYTTDASILEGLEDPKLEGLERFGAKAVVAYAITQQRPYVKIQKRAWAVDDVEATLIAGAHIVTSGVLRPTYPVTRVADEGSDVEAHLHLEPSGHTARVKNVRIGGAVKVEEI